MQETIHLSDLWEHTITKIFKLDPKYKVDQMIRQWVIYNKLEDFNSLLNYTDEDIKPYCGGNLSYYKENGDSVVKIMPTTPLQMLENLRWYSQHLINESGYLYDDDEFNYPLSEIKWMLQTHGKFMKYVIFTLHRMTPEQMKMNPIKPIIKVKTNEELDKEEGESIIDEEESTETSQELSEEQNSTSDIYIEDQEDSKSIETSQVHNVLNNPIPIDVDSHTVEDVTEIELPKENGEQNNAKEDKLLPTNFEMEIENRKVEGPITYSTDQQIFKFKVNSATDQEVWGVYIDSQSNQNKWTIHGILLHMGFYETTENPNVMMRENHNTKSSEYIFICQDDLSIASTTPQEILNMLKDKYKINIYLQGKYPHDPGGRVICQIQEYLEQLYENVNMLFNNKLPTNLYTTFEIIKLLFRKRNLNLIQQNYISTLHTSNFIKTSTTYMISFYKQETSYMKMKTKY